MKCCIHDVTKPCNTARAIIKVIKRDANTNRYNHTDFTIGSLRFIRGILQINNFANKPCKVTISLFTVIVVSLFEK